MRYLLFLLTILLLIGCKTQKDNSAKPRLKKNQLEVTVIEKATRVSRKTKETVNEYFLLLKDKNYFIKFSEGYVAKSKLKKYLNQKIIIKGEIKTGKWETDTPGSFINGNQPKKSRSGKYIIITKIYN
jgi:hypothetical protein